MKLSEEEITRHLLKSSETLGEVKGLISQSIEHHQSFSRDRKAEFKDLRDSIEELRKEQKSEIKQFVTGMNKKIDDNTRSCELRDELTNKKLDEIEELAGDAQKLADKLDQEIKLTKRHGYIFATLIGLPIIGWIIKSILGE